MIWKYRSLGHVEPSGRLDLEQLALRHPPDGVGDDVEQVVVAVVEREQEPARQEVVAQEHAHLVLPQRVHRRHAAPRVGLVDHVVVDERRRVEELDERGRPVRPLGDPAAELGREEHEGRPDLLPLPLQEVPDDGVEQPDARPHRVAEPAAEHAEVLGDRRPERVEPDGRGVGGWAGRGRRTRGAGLGGCRASANFQSRVKPGTRRPRPGLQPSAEAGGAARTHTTPAQRGTGAGW